MADSTLAVWRRWSSRRRSTPTGTLAGFDPIEMAEIDARLAVIGAGRSPQGLERRLSPLVDRGVPLRKIAPAPHVRACRVLFADGTTVLARGRHPGDAGVLAAAMRSHSLPPLACRTDLEGTHLDFAGPRWSGTLSLLVTGLDQAD